MLMLLRDVVRDVSRGVCQQAARASFSTAYSQCSLYLRYSIIIVDVVSRVSVSEYCQGGRACVGVGVWADKAG